MNPTRRRKSTLGRLNRNVGNSDKKPLPRLLAVTPRFRLGRLQPGARLKASNDCMTRKQLFCNGSTGKKTQFGSSSRATYSSPNDSQGSYQSDHSLNLTGVQSIKIPSPDYNSTTTNSTMGKSYQGYKSTVQSFSVKTPSLLKKATTWDKWNLEPPPSPPPSLYDRLVQQELANIKPPDDVCTDELADLENLTLNESSDLNRPFFKPVTSTVTKEVDVSKFSPHLSSTFGNSTFMLSLEKDKKPTANDSNTIQTLEKVQIPNKSEVYNNGHKGFIDNTNKQSCCAHDKKSSSFPNNVDYNEIKGSQNLDIRLNSHEKQNLNKERQVEPLKSDKSLSIFNGKPSLNADEKFDSSNDKTSNIVKPVNSVSGSLHCDKSEFRKPLELSKAQSSSSAVKYFETSKGTRLFSKNLDATLTSELNHNLNISNALPTFNSGEPDYIFTTSEDSNILPNANKHSETDRKLSVINEIIEKDLSIEDLNSTNSFLMAEQTIIDQDQYMTDPLTRNVVKTVIHKKHSIPKANETDSDDDIAQAMVKIDTITKNMASVRRVMNEWENDLKSVMTNLQQLKFKRSKLKVAENKENTPITGTKQRKSKWFEDMKSENPNLLKTPNPARQRVSRMSLANQSIMTPHSLSVVINDQLDDLFN